MKPTPSWIAPLSTAALLLLCSPMFVTVAHANESEAILAAGAKIVRSEAGKALAEKVLANPQARAALLNLMEINDFAIQLHGSLEAAVVDKLIVWPFTQEQYLKAYRIMGIQPDGSVVPPGAFPPPRKIQAETSPAVIALQRNGRELVEKAMEKPETAAALRAFLGFDQNHVPKKPWEWLLIDKLIQSDSPQTHELVCRILRIPCGGGSNPVKTGPDAIKPSEIRDIVAGPSIDLRESTLARKRVLESLHGSSWHYLVHSAGVNLDNAKKLGEIVGKDISWLRSHERETRDLLVDLVDRTTDAALPIKICRVLDLRYAWPPVDTKTPPLPNPGKTYDPTGYADRFKPLSPEEEARRKKEDAEREARWKAEREQREREEHERKEKIRAPLRAALTEKGVFGQSVRDYLSAEWVKSRAIEHGVALLFGNPYHAPSPEQAAHMTELVTEIIKKTLVIYDADSLAAPVIAAAAGDRGLGISGNPKRAQDERLKHVVVISNPFLRLQTYAAVRKSVMTPDSITGLGLAINKDLKAVYDPGETWVQGLVRFHDSFKLPEVNMGLYYSNMSAPDMLRTPARLVDYVTSYSEARKESLDPNLSERLDNASTDTLEKTSKFADTMSKGTEKMRSLPGGAVVFGGNRYESRYINDVFAVTYALARQGITIATGGSGGFMEAANTAAFNAGAASIGIPLDSGGLIGEGKVAGSVQTLTVGSVGYETRIPLLMDRRALIIMAPGGSGTMKELGTAVLHVGAHPHTDQELVFLCKGYYQALTEWLQGAFGPEFASKIHLVDTPEQADEVVQKVKQALGKNSSVLMPVEAPKPRNDKTKYEYTPPPPIEYPDYGDGYD